MSARRAFSMHFPGSGLLVFALALLATGNFNCAGCGPARDYTGDLIERQ